ncbi:MAG: PepSY domain-containing protein [Hyphomicrobiaceae bacterium]
MRKMALALALSICTTTAAFADSKPSDDEIAKINEAISVLGCSGGEIEKEDEASGYYEVDDAKCQDGMQFDIKLDEKFRIIDLSRD